MEEPAPRCLDDLSDGEEQIGSPISSSTGAMGSIIRKLHELQLAAKIHLPKRVEDVIQNLRGDLETTSSFLLDMCAMEEPNLTVNYWMEQARAMSYEMEDYLDTLKLSANIHGATKAGEYEQKGRVYLTKHSKAVHRRISEFRARVQEVNERHKRFMLGDCVGSRPRNEQPGRPLPVLNSMATEPELVGLEAPVDEILQWLKGNESQQLRVVSIVGCEGLGKSTLATKLSASIGWQFEHKAFVRVSRKPDLWRLLTNVLSQVRRQQEQQTEACETQTSLDNLREYLQDKRYLIVVDEIWTIPAWDILTRAFPDGNHGSIIITTTQFENVAHACCSRRTAYFYQMKNLSEEQSRKLFFSGVFGSEDKCPDEEFKEVSYGITRKCGGLPLAIVLACQAILSMKQWKHVVHSLPSELGTYHSKQMRQLLNLNYTGLPHHLKTCLLYLNIYPEDFIILKDDLVQQWIDEGFIGKDKGKDLDETARSYFDELVKRRMIQPQDVTCSGEVLSCKVHHMIQDFIAEKCSEQNFITVIDDSQTITGLPNKVHRLCIHFGSAKYATPPTGIRQSQVRSLAFFGFMKCMPSITDFTVLRVLVLELWGHDKSNCFDLSGVAALLHLRNLKVLCNVKVVLPAQMQNLKCLTTLGIDAEVTSVPSDIPHLPNLSQLSLPGDTLLSHGLDNMRSPHTSRYFDINKKKEEMDQRPGQFASLRSLRLNLLSAQSFNTDMDGFLNRLGNLRSLIISARSNQEKMKYFWVELHMESPPPLLKRLEFVTPISIFSIFPKWIGQLKILSVLRITVGEINMDTLGELPCLTILSLYLWRVPEGRIMFNSAAFPVLKSFEFMCAIYCLHFDKGAMPNLRRLKLAFNAHGTALYLHSVSSIRHLVKLEKFSADIGTMQRRESDISYAEAALKNAIIKHPAHPAININWVCSIFGGDDDMVTSIQQSKHWTVEEVPGSAGEILQEVQGMVDEDYMGPELKVPSTKRGPEQDLEQQQEIVEIDAEQDLTVVETEMRRSNVMTEIEMMQQLFKTKMMQEPRLSEKGETIMDSIGESLGVTTEVPNKQHCFLDGTEEGQKVPQIDWEKRYGMVSKQGKDASERFGSLHQEFGIREGKFEEEYAMGREANYWSNQSQGRPAPSWPEPEMETALGAANWLLSKVLNKLSNDQVAGVASRELGLNYGKITDELNHTLGLLHAAQGRNVSYNLGLHGLLDGLCKKADEAEDALDELHYSMIQDELDGTRPREAAPDLGDDLSAQAQHARHAARSTAGNWLSCFSCFCSQKDTNGGGKCDDKLSFDRVAMSNKIKHLLEGMHSKCSLISDLLKINPISSLQPSMPASTKRPDTSSDMQQKLFGRDDIFEKTVNEMIHAGQNGENLSVLPVVGPGGIGKTTFTQHLYNDRRILKHFTVKVWICVSTNFDVFKLSKEILGCLLATQNGRNKIAYQRFNLDQIQKSIAAIINSKRFLIVMDDIWECSSNDEWEKLLAPFKKGETTGNMVLVTTRFPKIVQMVTKETNPIELHGLDPDEFWKFFQLCAFGEIQEDHDKEDLIAIGRQIANKLKCSPLAAKTVGLLLKKRFSREQWVEILEKKEWLDQTHDGDIMAALKISYDYLPFHLKKCFSYCALYPRDYKFESLEIGRFLISTGITDSYGQNDKIEDIGSKYLDELFDYGFLIKGDDKYYVIHDLLHELAQIVSSQECAHISCNFRAENIPASIRHLSILMQNNYIESFGEEMDKLKRRIDIRNLRSLMIFGEYRRASLVNILKDTFKEIKGLRVLFIFMNSQNSLPGNFSKLVHLRYLKLKSPGYSDVCLPGTVSRFYHLKFLDLEDWESCSALPRGISHLVNMCHFAVYYKEFHSNIPEVGKMKLLQELRRFDVKKESAGFELRELGQLEELGGKLNIYGLENVTTREEANEAKLMSKRNLIELALVWSDRQPYAEDGILDSLQPHFSLRALSIVNHGGDTGPSWLCTNNHLKYLETLHLKGVSWSTLPPFGQLYHLGTLKLESIVGIRQFGPDFIGGITEKSFRHLKEIEFAAMEVFVEWVEGANKNLFSRLEKIWCADCPVLMGLPLSGFPNVRNLCTIACPKLCLPPLPHTSELSSLETDCLDYYDSELFIKLPCELAFHNLSKVESLSIDDASLLSLRDFHRLQGLRDINVRSCDETFLTGLDDGTVLQSVQSLRLVKFPITGKSMANLFNCFPSLFTLDVTADENHGDEEVVLQFPSSSSLRKVVLQGCRNLILPVEDGGGFQGLLSLESVWIKDCDKLFSRWSAGVGDFSNNPFPPSLKELEVWNEPSTLPMALLSNLTSLTRLELCDCKNIRVDGFNPLITSNLEYLWILNPREDGETEPYSIAADLLAEVARTKILPTGSFQLVALGVDSISRVLVAPICTRLSTTLRELCFSHDLWAESFTEEQEQALQLLTSLTYLGFESCSLLQSLPQGLHRLSSLEVLCISGSQRIRSLPNEGFPDSLQRLSIPVCCLELYEECQKLRGTRPDIQVEMYEY